MMMGLFLPADWDAVAFFPLLAWSISKKSLSDLTSIVLNLAAAPLSMRFRRSSAGFAYAPKVIVHNSPRSNFS